ncbi:MAG: phosphoglucosamine mutase [bacterium]
MTYFGTDGIRGRYNDVITKELSFKLGRALCKMGFYEVVVATDTRESKDDLVSGLVNGILSFGGKVVYGGVIPTPGLIYYSKLKKITGVMITASHNPFHDNGLKIVNNGIKLCSDEELLIEKYLEEDTQCYFNETVNIDKVVYNTYYSFLEKYIIKSNYDITIDCANGATYQIASDIFDKCSKQLSIISNEPNGKNINNKCGVMHLSNLLETNPKIGFSFDGDGDRIMAVENNKIIDGDQIVYIIAMYLKMHGMLKNNTVVLTKMSNIGILKKLTYENIKYILTDVGDKNVSKVLHDNNYSVGGENSGHIIINDILPTGDGMLIALFLIKIMHETKKTLNELLEGVHMYFDKMVNIKVKDRNIINKCSIVNMIKNIESNLDGKVIVRASGTEDVVRISVMAQSKEEVELNINKVVNLIEGET